MPRSYTNLLQHLFLLLLSSWILTGPMNLFFKILPDYGFVGGLQMDYLIPKLYIVDVVGIAVLLTWMFQIFTQKFWWKSPQNILDSLTPYGPPAFLFSLLATRQLFTPFPVSALWFLCTSALHIIIPYIFYCNWIALGSVVKKQWMEVIVGSVIACVVFQSLLGLYQFSTQREFIGYAFFGEPELSRGVSLSRANFAWLDDVIGSSLGYRILPYGTTPHSNILAGIVVAGVFILLTLWDFLEDKQTTSKAILLHTFLVICFTVLLISLSLSSLLAGVIGVTLVWNLPLFEKHIHRVKVQWMVLCALVFVSLFFATSLSWLKSVESFSTHASVTRRIRLNNAGIKMFTQNILSGVGLNQFTAEVETYSKVRETVRFVQPAHHVGILFLAENGILGVLILSIFLLRTAHRGSFPIYLMLVLFLLPILSLDHYLYTLSQGQWLIGLIWLVIIIKIRK